MAEYSISKETRMAFILAAGALFAEHGVEAVGIREIAAKAGENMGNIHYHFGGKKGLVKAVFDYAMEPCINDMYGQYLREHESDLTTRRGQAMVVGGIIDLHYQMVFSGTRPLWCGVLVTRSVENGSPAVEGVFEAGSKRFVGAFVTLFNRIVGQATPEDALAWVMMIVTSANILAQDMFSVQKIQRTFGVKDDILWRRLRDMTVRGALANVGLGAEADEVLKAIGK